MTNSNFTARVRVRPGLTVIDLAGEINAFAEKELNQAYGEAEQQGAAAVALSFNEVTYINSTGIALIVGLLGRAQKAQQSLCVWGLSEHYMEIFQITRLVDFLTIYPDEASAVQELLHDR